MKKFALALVVVVGWLYLVTPAPEDPHANRSEFRKGSVAIREGCGCHTPKE
jgi:hypothetical protein